MKRILLIGANGQLGRELALTLAPLGELISADRQTIDLTDPARMRPAILAVKPDLIVNAAAYTAVDRAETESELADLINATAPTILAETARQIDADLIHLSTDYVFDGRKNTPYLEEDPTNPIGVYGKSKLAGEEGIKQSCDRYLILRTAWVYGTYGKINFVKTMLRLGAQREEVRVVVDQIGSPTWAEDIASAIATLVSNSAPPGVYHFTNSGVASWYDFASAIFAEAERLGFPLKVKRLVPIATSEYPTPAQRPAYSVLSTKKISEVLGTYPQHWKSGLQQMLAQLFSQDASCF
ncbi:MAG: dTDP-4-dehydrorhamnose reductase [Cyanosarcina radialis HA8281-LM2]|jgi:dTDP-4-dehydrorhamnose reductase|nr:dTDP-4-dehydrorhamnose reductase [Cyanosarcina radialis HA8281-LM2]